MSDTRVTLLTPPGTGAIATVAVSGPQAWNRVRELFSKPLPEEPEPGRVWHGRFAGDDVVLAVKRPDVVEIHCHGGRRVVREVMDSCRAGWPPVSYLSACPDRATDANDTQVGNLRPQFATTLRTASILLDQQCGAFRRAVESLLDSFDAAKLAELAALAPVGRHLVDPWKVAIAGAPNVGKSSLINALAGYQRSVVSETPGTTRDVVTVRLAFDGWPVELADTAGLRDAAGLEAEGIARAERCLNEADLVLWVLDATATNQNPCLRGGLTVVNKCDLSPTSMPDAIRVSARTGEGIPGLIAAIVRSLIPVVPAPGAAVPFTPRFANLVERANAAASPEEAVVLLQSCLDS